MTELGAFQKGFSTLDDITKGCFGDLIIDSCQVTHEAPVLLLYVLLLILSSNLYLVLLCHSGSSSLK